MSTKIAATAVLSLAAFMPVLAQVRPIPYPVIEGGSWSRAVETGTRTATGSPGEKYWTNECRYDIKASLDPATAIVTGTATLGYTNRSPRALRQLRIHLRQNIHSEGAIRNTRVEITGGMKVSSVKLDGDPSPSFRWDQRSTVMNLRLPKRLPAGESVELEIAWSFRVPKAGQAPRMGHEDHHVFFLAYWYPQFAVCEDVEGWVADPYLGSGEFYMPYGSYSLEMTAPVGWLVRATGELTNADEVLTDEQLKRLEAARSGREVVSIVTADELTDGKLTARPDGVDTLTWKFRADHVRDCAVSLSDRYLWDATHAVVPNRDGPGKDGLCLIHAVYERNAPVWKQQAAEYARHTIEFMSKEVRPYPWPHMTVCEGIVGGGMEFPMMTNIGVAGIPRQLHGVVAHETIHMWFPMMVGSNEKSWAWMDEGVTSFFTTLASRDFWKSESPIRQAHEGYRATVRRPGGDATSMVHADHYAPRTGSGGFASYAKPSAVLHQLRGILGAEVFDEAMRTYAARWSYKHPYPYDLFNTFEEAAGQDLDWYFRTWMFEQWTLDQKVGKVDGGDEETLVTIEDLGLALGPTEVRVTYVDGRNETRVIPVAHWLKGGRSAALKFGPGVVRVQIDPDQTTLDVDPGNNAWGADEDRD